MGSFVRIDVHLQIIRKIYLSVRIERTTAYSIIALKMLKMHVTMYLEMMHVTCSM